MTSCLPADRCSICGLYIWWFRARHAINKLDNSPQHRDILCNVKQFNVQLERLMFCKDVCTLYHATFRRAISRNHSTLRWTISRNATPFVCTLYSVRHHADPCHETLHCNFCTVCNSSLFFLVVLAHTDEQYNNLLNTRESIIMINVRLSNRYFTRLIRQRPPIHFEVTWVTCSSHVRLQSIVTARFFADLDDVISLLSSVMLRSPGIFVSICGVPRTRSFVLSGLMSRLFLQHHAAMFGRSSVSWSTHS